MVNSGCYTFRQHHRPFIIGSPQCPQPPLPPFLPEAETAHLRRLYERAGVILEYGSGGSTELGARAPGNFLMSVESDQDQVRLRGPAMLSPAIVHHVDVGPTGPWGRPVNDRGWRGFHRYPNEIWDKPWFRHPDLVLVLIDGRFRTACLVTVMLHATRPVRVLFDDYGVRPLYHQVEEIITPTVMIGRMAEFRVEPGQVLSGQVALVIAQYFQGSVLGMRECDYQGHPRPMLRA